MPKNTPSSDLLKSSETETLCTITLRDNSILRYATSAMTLSANNYANYLLDVGELKQNTTPEIDRIGVKLSNTNDALGIIVASQLRKLELAEVLVEKFYSPVGNPNAYQIFYYYGGILTGAESLTEKQDEFSFIKYISFDVIPKRTASDISLADRNLSPSCAWKFKDPRTCGYLGPLTTCNQQLKSNSGCIRRLRTAQNGGWTSPEAAAASAPTGNGGYVGGGTCFPGDTLVTTPIGKRKINELRTVDEVITFNEKTLETKTERIVETFRHVVESYFEFSFSDNTKIKVTGEHNFLQTNGEWIRAEDFIFGRTEVWKSGNRKAIVIGGKVITAEMEVHNFHVSENETYISDDFLVHNSRKEPTG